MSCYASCGRRHRTAGARRSRRDRRGRHGRGYAARLGRSWPTSSTRGWTRRVGSRWWTRPRWARAAPLPHRGEVGW